MNAPNWPRIKEILDTALRRWAAEHNREPKLKVSHPGGLSWATKEELATSAPYELQLIETNKVGNGRATETNLIKILTRNLGGFRRMPSRGPYLSTGEIQEIVDWIDAGMPD
ncbi:MAG: cytochrome c [Desulfomonile sp.]|nr:cytochrome c [Desulfomonile sp.]